MNNAKNYDEKPIIKRESKNRIKVEFDDRTPFWERVKLKLLSGFFIKNVVWYIFRLVLLVGIAYIVLYPFFSKIMGSFMAPEDFIDATVILIPKNWTLDMYKYIFLELDYMTGFLNTLMLAGSTAVLQTFTCATIAYGLAKFKFKGSSLTGATAGRISSSMSRLRISEELMNAYPSFLTCPSSTRASCARLSSVR